MCDLANTAGGVLIFGVREDRDADRRTIPVGAEPIVVAETSREQLSQIMRTYSEPAIKGVQILFLTAPEQEDPSQVCCVVIVPQSDTAHMAWDGRYYWRNHTTTDVMRDHHVRDVMNRRKHPQLSVSSTKAWHFDRMSMHATLHLEIAVTNSGHVTARQFYVRIRSPLQLGGAMGFNVSAARYRTGDRRVSAPKLRPEQLLSVTEEHVGPLFPGRTIPIILDLRSAFPAESYYERLVTQDLHETVDVEMFADDMPQQKISIPIKDIPSLGPAT